MMLLVLFAFLAGIVTIASPCILPVLPILLSSTTDDSGKLRPIGIVIGFVGSFTFFTLFLSAIVTVSGIAADTFRTLSIIFIFLFGTTLVIPSVGALFEKWTSKSIAFIPIQPKKNGFIGGLGIGMSLGLLWTPCVGPILGSVISLALSGKVTSQAVYITGAYAIGTALPMFMILTVGASALRHLPWLTKHTRAIQKTFGILMLITAVSIALNIDRTFQSWVVTVFPTYGVGLTAIEQNEAVKSALLLMNPKQINGLPIGKPSSELTDRGGTPAPELIPGGQWFNSTPLTIAGLKGKVILIDFWTYTCINCQRTLPYVKKWWGTYKDQGLVVIGIHAPEFEFEKNEMNVQKAITDYGITYPVVQDNGFSTWRAYGNQYWPAKYLIDTNGHIRYTHFGEGEYDQTEAMIQSLLKEKGSLITKTPIDNPTYQVESQTPERYLGYGRIDAFASNETIKENVPSVYSFPDTLPVNSFAYAGNWSVMSEYAAPAKGGKLEISFNAKNVYLVARPKKTAGHAIVRLDGKAVGMGTDTLSGSLTIDSDRLYTLVQLSTAEKHTLTIEFLDDNTEVYAFTFG